MKLSPAQRRVFIAKWSHHLFGDYWGHVVWTTLCPRCAVARYEEALDCLTITDKGRAALEESNS